MVQYGTLSVQISVTATDWEQLVSYVFVSLTSLACVEDQTCVVILFRICFCAVCLTSQKWL